MRRIAIMIALLAGFGVAGVRVVHADPPHTHEYLSNRPSGFWTSNAPAVGGAYRYRLLLIGCAIALGTGLFMYRLVKKANAERAARQRAETDATNDEPPSRLHTT